MVSGINPIGDRTREWIKFTHAWKLQNPPLDNGYYICGICGRWIPGDEVTLDHIEPRRADNIFEPSNIQPAHWICNSRKGSQRWTPRVDAEAYEFLYKLSNM